jgi:hypothetical protein
MINFKLSFLWKSFFPSKEPEDIFPSFSACVCVCVYIMIHSWEERQCSHLFLRGFIFSLLCFLFFFFFFFFLFLLLLLIFEGIIIRDIDRRNHLFLFFFFCLLYQSSNADLVLDMSTTTKSNPTDADVSRLEMTRNRSRNFLWLEWSISRFRCGTFIIRRYHCTNTFVRQWNQSLFR